MIKTLWIALGLAFMGLAYVGVLVPGMPTTIFVILAAWAFSKSSPKLDRWLHTHPTFSPYLNNWEQKRIFPSVGRWTMVVTMSISLVVLALASPFKTVAMVGSFFVLVIIWAFRYPGSEAEYERRVTKGEKIGWW